MSSITQGYKSNAFKICIIRFIFKKDYRKFEINNKKHYLNETFVEISLVFFLLFA